MQRTILYRKKESVAIIAAVGTSFGETLFGDTPVRRRHLVICHVIRHLVIRHFGDVIW